MKTVKKALKYVLCFWLFIIIWFVSLLLECKETELEDWQKQVFAEQMIQ